MRSVLAVVLLTAAVLATAALSAAPVLSEGFVDRLRGRTGGACVDPATSVDGDVRRAARTILGEGLCVTETRISDGGLTFQFAQVENRRHPRGPVWYLPHDDEREAFVAALDAVVRYGGRLLALETGDQRNFGGIDPNRAFARTAAAARGCEAGRAFPRYTAFVMEAFRGRRNILTLHNNTRGGGVSVNMRGPKVTGFRASGRLNDPDHLVFIAGRAPIGEDVRAQALRDALLARGLNVVYEEVSADNNDCSLSNYVVLNDRRAYYNVEAVHGSRIQSAMVNALMSAIGVRPIAP